jgi:hypothetical protein
MEWTWLDNLLRGRAKLQVEEYVGGRGPAVAANREYLTVDVSALWITHVRKGLTKFYGAVHGSVQVPHETGETREFQAFDAIADAKELDAGHLDRIVQGPYRLLDSVPYRGKGINVRIALFSIKSADLAAPYIGLLKSVSDVAGVAFVSQATPLVNVIHAGVSALAGSDSLEIGRHGLFEPVYTGYYAVVRADPEKLPPNKLEFDADTRILSFDGKAVVDHPYFVLKITASPTRDYWYDIPDVKMAFSRMKEQFSRTPHEINKNLEAFDAFQVAASLSPDLLEDHAKNLVEDVRKRFAAFITEERRGVEDITSPLALNLQDLKPF